MASDSFALYQTEYSIAGSNVPDRRLTSSTSSDSSHHRGYERYASQDERQGMHVDLNISSTLFKLRHS